jgi:hypothetical protein
MFVAELELIYNTLISDKNFVHHFIIILNIQYIARLKINISIIYYLYMFNTSNNNHYHDNKHGHMDAYDSYIVKIESNESEIDNFIENGHKYCALSHNTPYKIKMINNTDLHANAILRIDGEIMGKWRLNAYSDIIIERPTHNNRKFIFVREDSWEGGMGGIKKGDNMNGVVEVTFIPEIRTYDDSFHHLKNIYVPDGFGRSFPLVNRSGSDSGADSGSGSDSGSWPGSWSGYGYGYESGLGPGFKRNISQNAKISSDMLSYDSDGIGSNMKGYDRSYESYSVGGTVLGGSSGQRFGSASHIVEDLPNKQIKRIRLIVKKTQPYISIKTKKYVDSDIGRYDDQIPPQLKNPSFVKPFTINPPVSDSWTIWPF